MIGLPGSFIQEHEAAFHAVVTSFRGVCLEDADEFSERFRMCAEAPDMETVKRSLQMLLRDVDGQIAMCQKTRQECVNIWAAQKIKESQ